MGLKAKETIIHVRKGSVFFMRVVFRSVPDHPFICAFAFYLFVLYRYFPTLFAFVISSSPVVICAVLLLGILLIYGDTNVPEPEIKSTAARPRTLAKNICLEDNIVSANAHLAGKKEMESNEDHDSSSELEGEVNSSPDASVADIIPLPDELHPLLDSEAPETALRSVDDSEQESDDDSIDEELDNQEEEEEEDAHEEKDDVNEEVLKWTADDQKNLIDLGTSELERNRRLENLIAKRTARKFLSFHEKSLIDLDISDPVPNTEYNSQLNVQVPPIFAPRRNPFDIPFEGESNTGIPPIPGSAPSILQPRPNPFDAPFIHGEENQNLFFVRNDFFSTGASSSSNTKHDVPNTVMKPYFVAEKKVSFDGVSTEKDDSIVSSEAESESTISHTEQEVHNELVEPEIRSVNHVAVLGNQYDGTLEIDSQSSEEVESVDDSNEQLGTDENTNDSGINASNDTAVEIEIRHGEYIGHDTGDGDLDELDGESYDDMSSLTSEADDNQSTISMQDSNKSEQARDNNSAIFPDDPVQSVSGDDGHVPEPVYDSSPTASEKVTIDETLLFADKEDSTFEDSSTSSQRQPHDNEVSSEEQHHESNNENNYEATSSLSSVNENELKSREITEIKEKDIFRITIPRTNEHEHIPSPVMPKRFGISRRLSLNSNDSLSNLDLPPIPEEQPEYSKPDENSTDQNAATDEDSKDGGESEASSSSSVNLEKVRNISKFW